MDPQIDFHEGNWGDAPTGTLVEADDVFSERWVGYVKIDNTGWWKFHTKSNDGVRLWVAGQLMIEEWTKHLESEHIKGLKLEAGWHPIRLEHYQSGETVTMQLSFSRPPRRKTIIPASHLSAVHPRTGDPVRHNASINNSRRSKSQFAESIS